MVTVVQVSGWKFPSGLDQEIAIVNVPLEVLSARLALELEEWEEDGLGMARGAVVSAPSGRTFLLRELRYLVETGKLTGTEIIADGGDVADLGVDLLVRDICDALGISSGQVVWQAGSEVERRSREIVTIMRAPKS